VKTYSITITGTITNNSSNGDAVATDTFTLDVTENCAVTSDTITITPSLTAD
jgi:hypothetical protein